jgi:hypothetical protein
MNSVRFTIPCLVADARKFVRSAAVGFLSSGSKIRAIPEDIESSGHLQKCGNCSTERSAIKRETAEFAKNLSPTITTSCPTTSSRKVWEQREETIIPTTFKRPIGSAIWKKDQRE